MMDLLLKIIFPGVIHSEEDLLFYPFSSYFYFSFYTSWGNTWDAVRTQWDVLWWAWLKRVLVNLLMNLWGVKRTNWPPIGSTGPQIPFMLSTVSKTWKVRGFIEIYQKSGIWCTVSFVENPPTNNFFFILERFSSFRWAFIYLILWM